MQTSRNIKILLLSMIVFVPIGIYVRFRTLRSKPPSGLVFGYALVGFYMSINWISFTSDMVVDLLGLLGLMLSLPKSLLGLTLLAWGNCMGDMNANVAMTKKGFGEMAVTGCMAGPIFNLLVGIGASTIIKFIKGGNNVSIAFSIYSKSSNGEKILNTDAVTPLVLIGAQIIVLVVIAINGVKNDYKISTPLNNLNLVIYAISVAGLVVY